MVGKTYPELTASNDVADADLLAAYRTPGPLRKILMSTLKDYMGGQFADRDGANLTESEPDAFLAAISAVKIDASNFADDAAKTVFREGIGVQDVNTYSLLNALSPAERATVLAGGDPGGIGAKLNALIAAARPGSVIDASMLRGTITLATSPFAGLVYAPVTLLTGSCRFEADFVTMGSLALPHEFHWRMEGTVVAPNANITTWPGQFDQGFGLLETGFWTGTVSGASGALTVTVADGSLFRVGSKIAINGIKELTNIQETITDAFTASTPATVNFSPAAVNTLNNGFAYIKIDSEIILLIVASGGATATVQTRGALGTTAATHSAGSVVTAMVADVFEVTDVSGNVLTLDRALPVSFTDAPWWAGTVNSRITGWGEIDGKWDRVYTVTRGWNGVLSTLSNGFQFEGDFKVNRCNFAGVFLQGAYRARVKIQGLAGNGDTVNNTGASVWLFTGAKHNTVEVDRAENGYVAAVIDAKSSNINQMGLAMPADDNSIVIRHVETHEYSLELSAGARNSIVIDVDESEHGPYINAGFPQYTTGIQPVNNYVSIGRAINFLSYITQPRVENAANNTVIINGQRGRVIDGTLTLGSGFSLVAGEASNQTPSLTGAKTTDLFSVTPGQNLPDSVVLLAGPGAADGGARISIVNAAAVSRTIQAGWTFRLRAEGPWNV